MRRDGPGHGGPKPKQSGMGPMDPNGFIVSKMIREGICSDCTVLAGKAEITFEDGSPAGIDVSRFYPSYRLLRFKPSRG